MGSKVFARPVFAVGGTVSGYASLGSAESLPGESSRDKAVWNPTSSDNRNESRQTGRMTEEAADQRSAQSAFKSSFAKELLEENQNQTVTSRNSWREPTARTEFADEDRIEIVSEDSAEYSRVKAENELLKRKLTLLNREDERYKKMEFEIEQLTWQLGKMEQSRRVYESATHQLGSFLELVSSKLTLAESAGAGAGERRVSRNMSRAGRGAGRGGAEQARRKSCHSLPSYKPALPSLSPSTSCGSSSLTTNTSGEQERRPATAAAACTCTPEERQQEEKQKSKSKTRKAIRRMTSFMRKDKSESLSFEELSKNSLKYSSEHFSDPATSMNIIGFRGIWSLRNY